MWQLHPIEMAMNGYNFSPSGCLQVSNVILKLTAPALATQTNQRTFLHGM